jgi:hypothetical protein
MKYTVAQSAAIREIDTNTHITTVAGSGKSTTQAARVVKCLMTKDVVPSNIIVFVYNEDAAVSLRKKITALAGVDAHQVGFVGLIRFPGNAVYREGLDPVSDHRATILVGGAFQGALEPVHLQTRRVRRGEGRQPLPALLEFHHGGKGVGRPGRELPLVVDRGHERGQVFGSGERLRWA